MNGQAPDNPGEHLPVNGWMARLKDLLITLALWGYFTLGFCIFFSPFFLWSLLFAQNRQFAIQKLNSYFLKGFFKLCRLLIPKVRWHIDPQVHRIRGAVIIANHVSYLDSILMVSLFARHNTIAKARLFDIPLFRLNLNSAGYIPSNATGRNSLKMQQRVEQLPDYLSQGGNLILFPEGTRSRTGIVNPFQKGGFKIARICKAPLKVVVIHNTDHLFEPGRFLFNTCQHNTITVKLVATLTPDYRQPGFSLNTLMEQVRQLMANNERNRSD